MVKQGYEITIVVPNDFTAKEIIPNVTYHFISFNQKIVKAYLNIFSFIQVFLFVKKTKPDLIISYTLVPNIMGSLIGSCLKIPVINNITGLGSLFVSTSLVNPMIKKVFKYALSKSYKTIVLNKDDFEYLLSTQFIQKEKLVLLNGEGVDEIKFTLEKYKTESYNTNTPKDVFTFLFIGRLLKEKGIIEFIEAAKYILNQHPTKNIAFQIIGEFDTGNRSVISPIQLSALLEKYPGIHYLGFQENIPSYIANSNCVVLPSYREGMPRVLLEAASMQKPIIASNVAGCSDLVIPNYNGLLCHSKDIKSLASSMQVMLEMPAPALEQMGLNGRKLILEKFTSTIINQEYHSILQTIID